MLAAETLRKGLLDGVSVLLAGAPAPSDSIVESVSAACTELGACVSRCLPISDQSISDRPISDQSDIADEAAADAMVGAVLNEAGSIDLLVVDGAGLFAYGASAKSALRTCLDATWNITRAVTNLAFLPDARGGRIVYVAPPPAAGADPDAGAGGNAGAGAKAACAGLENLSRTLSVEWARHGIAVLTIAPGGQTVADEVSALTAYIASPAGAYFSGCLLDLRGLSSS